jgi:hypothetical protein
VLTNSKAATQNTGVIKERMAFSPRHEKGRAMIPKIGKRGVEHGSGKRRRSENPRHGQRRSPMLRLTTAAGSGAARESFAGKRQRKSRRGQIIRIHVSPPGMLSKILNNHVCNLTHANVSPNTNDMHAN